MTKLKRCPFCGGEAEIIRYGLNKKSMLYTPHCKNEYCEGYAGRAYESKKLAISMWNTRTPEIVRCGECEHYIGDDISGQCGFCIYEERREEE